MADLPENDASYPTGIRQIETDEKAVGGDTTKPPNEQLLTLANRTAFLNTNLNTKQDQAVNLDQLANLSLIADQLLGTDGAANLVLKAIPSIAIAVLSDEKSSYAGTGSPGIWQRRDLNVISQVGGSFCFLSNNQFTLDPGKYGIIAVVPATMTDAHQCRLWSVTDFAQIKIGTSTQTVTSDSIGGQSLTTYTFLLAALNITSSKTYEIQHYIKDTITNRSLGAETGIGAGEAYTQVFIVRI